MFVNKVAQELASCWNACYPHEYQLTADSIATLQLSWPDYVQESSIFLYDPSGELQAFALCKNTARGRFEERFAFGQPLGTLHLSALAYRTVAYGKAVLDGFVAKNISHPIVFGQDQGHLLPGCPAEMPEMLGLLDEAGFKVQGEAYDFARDICDYVPPCIVSTEAVFRPMAPGDLPSLKEFFEREFPGRWRADVLQQVQVNGPQDIFLMLIDGRVQGFACLQNAQSRLKIGGAVLHAAYGANWCTLGPIGISNSLRGHGLGDSLLASALLHMKAQGGRMCIIDWTVLEKYYGKHGFKVLRTYKLASRPATSLVGSAATPS